MLKSRFSWLIKNYVLKLEILKPEVILAVSKVDFSLTSDLFNVQIAQGEMSIRKTGRKCQV